VIAGRVLEGLVVIDIDATLISSSSPKEGAWVRIKPASAFILSAAGARIPGSPGHETAPGQRRI
jgi:hypothetical protein